MVEIICPKCRCVEYCKAGMVQGRQRYKCKTCGYYYSVAKKSDVKSDETRRLALEMYLEGLGFRAIGRILKISYGTVYCWVKLWGEQAILPKREDPIEIVELDELHTYVRSKKTTRGYGLLLIDLENGSALLSAETVRHGRG